MKKTIVFFGIKVPLSEIKEKIENCKKCKFTGKKNEKDCFLKKIHLNGKKCFLKKNYLKNPLFYEDIILIPPISFNNVEDMFITENLNILDIIILVDIGKYQAYIYKGFDINTTKKKILPKFGKIYKVMTENELVLKEIEDLRILSKFKQQLN